MNRLIRFHIPWMSCIALLIGTILIDNAWHRGVTVAPTDDASPAAAAAGLGVNLYNIQYEPDPAVVERSFAEATRLGARFARIQLPWEDVEIHGRGDYEDRRHTPDSYSAWLKYDHIVAMAAKHHIELIVRIDRPPAWARQRVAATPKFQAGLIENGDSTGPPDDYDDYARFVAAVAARYPQVRYIQLWNEPNLAYEWNWELPDPVAFTDLLSRASRAARAANPNVIILFPSLSPTDGKEPRIAPMSELDFLAACYRAGAADAFDIMSAQAYGLGQPPDEHRYVRVRWNPLRPWAELDRPIDTRIDVSRIVMLREVMLQHDDAATAVWVSEFGYNSAPESIPPERRTIWGPPVSEVQKGEYIVAQLARARREWPWLGVMNLWMLRWGGPPADPANPTPFFAIMAPDFAPYPAYGIIQATMQNPSSAGAGSHAWSHPAIQSLGADSYRITFSGTAVGIRGLTADLSVSVDNGPVTYVSTGSGEAVLASGLADGVHTLTISGIRQAPTALLVWRNQPWRWLFAALPVVLTAALAYTLSRVFAPYRGTHERPNTIQ
ncbi:MAG: hypothetical protein RLY87_2379 [Chloroflexota bacterium]|jgi:hypothetical protein